jgi:ketosteroid isomerase-like protein
VATPDSILNMKRDTAHEPAGAPEQLTTFLLMRMNAGDVEGVVALYQDDARLVLPDGQVAVGANEIRAFYRALLADRPHFASGTQSPPLLNGDVVLTSSTLPNGKVTAEIACRQSDGTWRWSIDHPAIGNAAAE